MLAKEDAEDGAPMAPMSDLDIVEAAGDDVRNVLTMKRLRSREQAKNEHVAGGLHRMSSELLDSPPTGSQGRAYAAPPPRPPPDRRRSQNALMPSYCPRQSARASLSS
jgi:hypothetical protein